MMPELPEHYFAGKKITSEDLNKIIDFLNRVAQFIGNYEMFITDHIEKGVVQNISTENTGVVYGVVNFSKAFKDKPIVLLSLENVHNNVIINFVSCENVSKTGFNWKISIGKRERGTYCNLNWLAIL